MARRHVQPDALYRPLEESDIRLLTVIRHDGSRAFCRLDTVPREEAPEYDAISYCWGEDTRTSTITCNSSEHAIRTSLFVALKYFLDGRPPPLRPLWIDAICVNQADADEKAVQVPRMGEIYKFATRTLIWLGEGTDESDEVLENINRLHQRLHGESARQDEQTASRLKEEGLMPDPDGVRNLLLRPWFSRLWVVQEVALSGELDVLCGRVSLAWSIFSGAIEFLRSCNLAHLYFDFDQPLVVNVDADPMFKTMWLDITRSNLRRDGHLLLSVLLQYCEHRQCHEPVDRIWAVIGLVEDNVQQHVREAGIVDYSTLGKRQYWMSYLAIMKLLYKTKRDDFWYSLLWGQGLAKPSPLPSLSPDFTANRIYVTFEMDTKLRAGYPDAASAEEFADPPLLLESDHLSVDGFEIDDVQHVTTTLDIASSGFSVEETALFPWRWLQECFPIIKDVLGPPHNVLEAFGRTLNGGMLKPEDFGDDEVWERLMATLSDVCEAWTDSSATSELDLIPSSRAYSLRHAFGRRFFNTQNGRIGLGPPHMRTSDKICVFRNTRPLFVLRVASQTPPATTGEYHEDQLANQKETFSLIGDACVTALMHGEAFAAETRGPDRTFVLV